MAKEQGQPKKRRIRLKGFPWLAGLLINPDKPFGKAWAYRPWRVVPVTIWRRPWGVSQLHEKLANFDCALELNARAIHAYSEAAQDDVLPMEVLQALKQLPEFSDERYSEAVDRLTIFSSVTAHRAALAKSVAQAVRERKHTVSLAELVQVQRVLNKGRCDAALMDDRLQDFIRNTIRHNHHPSEPVLLRTFLPFALVERTMISVSQIKAALCARRAYRRSSNVTAGELALMAMHAQVNPAVLYLDYHYLSDLLALAVYAGAAARGKLAPLSAMDAATYRCMLTVDGTDPETDPNLRRERANLASALRRGWVQVPGLAEATREFGTLAAP